MAAIRNSDTPQVVPGLYFSLEISRIRERRENMRENSVWVCGLLREHTNSLLLMLINLRRRIKEKTSNHAPRCTLSTLLHLSTAQAAYDEPSRLSVLEIVQTLCR
jgi:hypothetical protein